MDYLIVIFLSLLTPFSLSMSDVDYTTGLGIKISNSTDQGFLYNKIEASAIKTGSRSDNDIISARHYGPYGVFYDLSVEYQVYPFVYKDNYLQNFWIAPKFSYEPLRDSALIVMKPLSSDRTKAVPVMFNQHPSFGFNIGYDAYRFKKGGEIISPYFGMQFMRVGYEGESNFDMQELFDSSIQYNLGLSYKMDTNWAANVEISTMYIDMKAIEDQGQDITARLTRVKMGVTYYLKDNIVSQKENKDETYTSILKSIDPNFKNKMKEQKRLDEQKELEKEAANKKKENPVKAEAEKNTNTQNINTRPLQNSDVKIEQNRQEPVRKGRLNRTNTPAQKKKLFGLF